jgi:hypothetical protein
MQADQRGLTGLRRTAIRTRIRRILRPASPLVAIFALLASPQANAGAYCYGEIVTGVFMQGGSVYFTTSKSCPNWCLVGSAWNATEQSQAFAMLVASKTTGETMTFYWNEQTSECSPAEPVSASPTLIAMQ